jgi:DNA-binding NtrC family response regulator
MATILVVDDELGIRALLSEILSDEGHTVEVAEDAAEARSLRERIKPDLVLLDIWMPDVDGITLLKEWSSGGHLTMPVIMMSGHGTIDTAVEAMKFGASAFLEKPVTLQKLLRAVEEGLSRPADTKGSPVGAVSTAALVGHPPGVLASGLAARGGAIGALAASAGPGGSVAQGSGMDAAVAGGVVTTLAGGSTGFAAADEGARGVNGALSSHQSFELDRPLREARDAFEKSYFEYHLAKENGSMTRVAEKTGLERTHLYRKLKHLGVDLSRTKRQSN